MQEIVYIAGPITGTNDWPKRFADAEAYMRAKGYKVINPAKINGPMADVLTYDQMMAICFKLIDFADAIYIIDGQCKSVDVSKEFGYAIAKGKQILIGGADKVIENIKDIELSRLELPIIVVYNHPIDYPDKVVARIFDVQYPTRQIILRDTIQEMQQELGKELERMWLRWFPRRADYMPQVVGAWA